MAAAAIFDAGPLGKLSVNGIVTGFAQFQNNSVSPDHETQATLSNGQIFIQKRTESSSTTSRLAPTPCRRFPCSLLTPKTP